MQGVNKVILIGRLGADPEVRQTPNGQTVATLNLATSESWMKEGQREERTEWHRVVVWGRQAENVGKFLSKGRSCFVEGKLQTRSWEDKETRQKRFSTEIVAMNVQFLDSGRGQGQGQGQDDSSPYSPSPSRSQGNGGGQYGASNNSNSYGNQGAQQGGGASQPSTPAHDFGSLDDDVPF